MLVQLRSMRIVHPITRQPLSKINELEYVLEGAGAGSAGEGMIYANLWYDDHIVVLRETDGQVVHVYDMSPLFPQKERAEYMAKAKQKHLLSVLSGGGGNRKHTRPPTVDCFNGIAYNSTDETFLVTGKWWPAYYKVRLSEHRKHESTGSAAAFERKKATAIGESVEF